MGQKIERVAMTAEERAEYEAFLHEKAEKALEEKKRVMREEYRRLVDNEIENCIPDLLTLSEGIKDTKKSVLESFRTVLEMKGEIMDAPIDDQRSHTFTNTAGDKRVMLGVYVTDGYLDTVEDGIAIVKDYITSLAGDSKTKSLVNMVLKLLSRDAQGTLKASRIVQLHKIADESGDQRFQEGVKIIEESYRPVISKQFVRAERRDETGAWKSIPLGMTEA